MAHIIEMPKLSDTMEEGGVSEWFKKEGDFVAEGDLLLSIDTDKATMEYTSPEEGFLIKILEKPGAQVALGVPIAVLGEKGEVYKASQSKKTNPEKKKVVKKKKIKEEKTQSSLEKSTRIKASPLAKKIAREKQVELSSLVGSGPLGRIVAKDVEAQVGASSVGSSFVAREDRAVPLTMMRKTIAKRLVQSKQEAPHFYLTVSCKSAELRKWKDALNQSKKVEGLKVSLNDLLLFVCSRALSKHPEINSLWQGDSILQCGSVDISVAVALPEGLVTPVVRQCERKDIWQIAAESKALVQKAKSKGLMPEDYAGGSFTVSNLGMTKVESFTAVINSPQTCILAVGRSQKEAVVQEDGSLAAEERMKMTLSCDHRAVDGLMGAKFLETLVQFVEMPVLMFS